MRNTEVICTCPFCTKNHFVMVSMEAYERWQAGELIQYAMPNLTPTEREQLISGLCPECQQKVFGC